MRGGGTRAVTTETESAAPAPKRMEVLGIPVNLLTMETAVATVRAWVETGPARTVFVRDVASLMTAMDTPVLRALHMKADLVVPDGMPLVWIGKLRGHGARIGRVAGADLMDAVCAASLETGQSHYFYGGLPGVADEMANRLKTRFPGLVVAGTFSPPMRALVETSCPTEALRAEIETIRRASPDFIWIGISSPKQEYWMMQAAPLFERGVFFGVGAAFDYHSGRIRRAPVWMRNTGLEWLYRLCSEPRRLWRRYLVQAPRFVWLIALEAMGLGRKADVVAGATEAAQDGPL